MCHQIFSLNVFNSIQDLHTHVNLFTDFKGSFKNIEKHYLGEHED